MASRSPDATGEPRPSAAFTCDVVIVGAGLSGLAAAYALKQRGLTPRLIDQRSAIGDIWRTRHPGLHLNTHRWTSYLPGKRHSSRLPGFPSRDDFIRYLEDYAAAVDVPIDFGVDAQKLNRDAEGWNVETKSGTYAGRCAVVATGPQKEPKFPDWPGRDRLRAEIIHSGAFGDAGGFAGRKVVIVGAGNSGIDIANHLSRVDTEKIWVSARSGINVIPQRVLGYPIQASSPTLERLPLRLQDGVARLATRAKLGDLRRHGVPLDPMGPASRFHHDSTAPGIDDGFVAALKQKRIEMLGEVDYCEETSLVLKDGQRVDPDVVICATGYRAALEPLVGHLGVLDEAGQPRFVAADTSPDHPGLWFFGLNESFYGSIRQRRLEAPHLASTIEQYLAAPQ